MGYEPIPVHVLRYACPFCRRSRSKLQAAKNHIERCFKNPAAKGCKTCMYFEPGEKEDYLTGYPGCPQLCGQSVDISEDGLQTGCALYEGLGAA